jgi:hypothetical protein
MTAIDVSHITMQARAIIRYSVTVSAAGGISRTCTREATRPGVPARSAPHPPHVPGSADRVSFGRAVHARLAPGWPFCPPCGRPGRARRASRWPADQGIASRPRVLAAFGQGKDLGVAAGALDQAGQRGLARLADYVGPAGPARLLYLTIIQVFGWLRLLNPAARRRRTPRSWCSVMR